MKERRRELVNHFRKLQERWPFIAGLDGSSPESRGIDDWNRDRSSFVVALNEWVEWAKGVWRPLLDGDRDLPVSARMSIANAENFFKMVQLRLEGIPHIEKDPRIEANDSASAKENANVNANEIAKENENVRENVKENANENVKENTSADDETSPDDGCESPDDDCVSPDDGCESPPDEPITPDEEPITPDEEPSTPDDETITPDNAPRRAAYARR